MQALISRLHSNIAILIAIIPCCQIIQKFAKFTITMQRQSYDSCLSYFAISVFQKRRKLKIHVACQKTGSSVQWLCSFNLMIAVQVNLRKFDRTWEPSCSTLEGFKYGCWEDVSLYISLRTRSFIGIESRYYQRSIPVNKGSSSAGLENKTEPHGL